MAFRACGMILYIYDTGESMSLHLLRRALRRAAACLVAAALCPALAGCAALALHPKTPVSPPPPSPRTEEAASPAAEAEPSLMISEVMADNATYFLQGFADWIELFNPGDAAVDLSDYYISEDEFHPYAYRLPAAALEPGGFAVLVCARELPFGLAKEGGTLVLTLAGGSTADVIEYPALGEDESYASGEICARATPGFANTQEGYSAYRAGLPPGLVINEALSKNAGAYAVNGEYPDAVELKNLSDAPVELSDYFLSDDADDLLLWRLPSMTLAPGELIVFPATGDALTGAPFRIGSDGEALYLTKADGSVADALLVPALAANVGYGRAGDAYALFQPPTLGFENAQGTQTPLEAPAASLAPGMYASPVTVALAGEGEIYYTLNGAEPTKTRGRLYDGTPVEIAATASLRARAYSGDAASPAAAYCYFIGEPDYALPVLKLTAPYGAVTGGGSIYENYMGSREVKANLAFFIGGEQEFSLDCGVSMFGAGSRELPKKSFKLRFRKIYGDGKLAYNMFEGLGIGAFDALVLRSGSEDQSRALFRDELMTSLVGFSDMDTLHVQAYRAVNLYINEEYFGIYFVREWVREGYVAAHLNVSEASVSIVEGWESAIRGSAESYLEALDYCRENGDLSDDAKCAFVLDRIEETSLMDYYIARAYGGDQDFANIRHIRSSEGDGKWRVVFFDLDWAFTGSSGDGPFHVLLGARKNLRGHNNVMMRALLTNASFRARFLARVGHELATTFSTENVLARIDGLERALEADMPYECRRWRRSMESWRENVERLRDFARDGRGSASGRAGFLAADAAAAFDMTEEEIAAYLSGVIDN